MTCSGGISPRNMRNTSRIGTRGSGPTGRSAAFAFSGDSACYAEKVPGGILDVVRIHRAVRLKLRAAIREAAHVIEGNAALPQMRRIAGTELSHTVETDG